MKLTLPQKIILLNTMSVLLGTVGGVFSELIYDFVGQGKTIPYLFSILMLLVLLLLLIGFCKITAYRTDAEVFLDLILDERKVALEVQAMNSKEKVSNKSAKTAINDEIKKAASSGDLDKAHKLAELKGKI